MTDTNDDEDDDEDDVDDGHDGDEQTEDWGHQEQKRNPQQELPCGGGEVGRFIPECCCFTKPSKNIRQNNTAETHPQTADVTRS